MLAVVAPGLLLAGFAAGKWVSQGDAVWQNGTTAAAGPAIESHGFPSLAPIIRRVRAGVVGIRTVRRANAEATLQESLVSSPASAAGAVINGTGFIINESGLAVTNHHLVAQHERITVEIQGEQPVEAELVGDDPVTDIAVVRFPPPKAGLTALPLGDSTTVEQGDWVLAMGNPFHYRQTVTVGIVSYVGRHLPDEGLLVSNEYLQFSAQVNPGSSGGPVLDMQGNVVGVTASAHAAASGISFAVPSKVLKWVLERMNEGDGKVRRGFLGIRFAPLDAATTRELGLAEGGGAEVRSVERGRPADHAGVRPGDILVSYNGRPVPDAYTLFDWITYSAPGGRAVIEVLRDGARLPPLVAQLGEVEFPRAPGTPVPRRGDVSH